MRRATRPAICTQVTSAPVEVTRCSALRSFSSDALSRAAFTKFPLWYQVCRTSASTGLRFECTLNTFMKTLIFNASRSSHGSRAMPTLTTRPSAADSTASAWDGISRGGSRKNCRMKTKAIHASAAGSHHDAIDSATATARTTSRKGQPSRAMIGCGYAAKIRGDTAYGAIPASLRDGGVDALLLVDRVLADLRLQRARARHRVAWRHRRGVLGLVAGCLHVLRLGLRRSASHAVFLQEHARHQGDDDQGEHEADQAQPPLLTMRKRHGALPDAGRRVEYTVGPRGTGPGCVSAAFRLRPGRASVAGLV